MAHLRCDFFSEALSLSTSMTVLLPSAIRAYWTILSAELPQLVG